VAILRISLVMLVLAFASSAHAQSKPPKGDILSDAPDMETQTEQLQHALVRLPIAAGLATMLAMRPVMNGSMIDDRWK